MKLKDREFERRTAQFLGYIGPMFRRSREVMEFCYLIFEEAFTDDDGAVHRSAARTKSQTLVLSRSHAGWDTDGAGLRGDLGAQVDEACSRNRYAQIGFEENYFFLDLPSGKLFPDEADEIISARSGFRRASDNPVTPTTEEHIRDFDPLQKFYLYGEEAEAAEDVAHLFFRVLGLPQNGRLYASSNSLSGKAWERGEPFE